MSNLKSLARGMAAVMLAAAFAGCDSGDAKTPSGNAGSKPATDADCCPDCVETKAGPSTKPATQPVASPATKPTAGDAAAKPAEGTPLFDGKTLGKWKSSGFAAQGEPEVKDGLLVLPTGEGLTGVTWTGDNLPKSNYEIEVVARRAEGHDFFCGITFPVNDSHASLIVGGWGGAVVGISMINDEDAAHNETTTYEKFEKGKWYTVRLRVEAEKLQAWIDGKQVVNVDIKGKKIEVRTGIDEAKPLGLSSWTTTAEIKSVTLKKL